MLEELSIVAEGLGNRSKSTSTDDPLLGTQRFHLQTGADFRGANVLGKLAYISSVPKMSLVYL